MNVLQVVLSLLVRKVVKKVVIDFLRSHCVDDSCCLLDTVTSDKGACNIACTGVVACYSTIQTAGRVFDGQEVFIVEYMQVGRPGLDVVFGIVQIRGRKKTAFVIQEVVGIYACRTRNDLHQTVGWYSGAGHRIEAAF